MEPTRFNILTTALFGLGMATAAHAATIDYIGFVTGAEGTHWLNTSTPKTMDIDGDNRYGTMGAVNFKVGDYNRKNLPSGASTLGWAFVSSGTQISVNSNYSHIDYISDPTLMTATGLALNSFTFQLTGTAADYAGKTVRVGVMEDTLRSVEWSQDTFKGLSITQVGGTTTSGTISLRGGAGGNGVPEIYFFDITGATAGDQFTINALSNVGGTTGATAAYLAAVTFDIAATAVPAPAALEGGLVLLGIIATTRRRNR